MNYHKLIKKYAKIRMMPSDFADTAIGYYESLPKNDREAMKKEFQDYLDGVNNGTIIPTQVALPKIPSI